MKQKFGVLLLGEVWELLDTLDEKTKDKIFYNIDKSKYVNDPELFKKLEALGSDMEFYGNIGSPSLLIGDMDISA